MQVLKLKINIIDVCSVERNLQYQQKATGSFERRANHSNDCGTKYSRLWV